MSSRKRRGKREERVHKADRPFLIGKRVSADRIAQVASQAPPKPAMRRSLRRQKARILKLYSRYTAVLKQGHKVGGTYHRSWSSSTAPAVDTWTATNARGFLAYLAQRKNRRKGQKRIGVRTFMRDVSILLTVYDHERRTTSSQTLTKDTVIAI